MSYKILAAAVLKRAVMDGATSDLETTWCQTLADLAEIDIEKVKREAKGNSSRRPQIYDEGIPSTCRGRNYCETMRNIGTLPKLYSADEIAEFMGITRQRVAILAGNLHVKYRRLTYRERGARTRNQWSSK